MAPGAPLPEYVHPPVAEVVCGVQFAPLDAFASVHFGQFWERVKADYPRVEDREPLADVFEGKGIQLSTELLNKPPLRRVFLIEGDGRFLLQVQPSRFLANWRKEQSADEYPRFSTAYDKFLRGWTSILRFLKEEGIGTPSINQYELTYINHIPESARAFPAGIGDYLPILSWSAAQSSKFLPSPRAAGLRLQFPLPDDKGVLHVTANQAQRVTDRRNIVVLDLTARGSGERGGTDMTEWFKLAHEWIVRGFTDLTSASAHAEWGRRL